ncbi:hypothetical protein Tco_0217839 [Tanacetum coccineum]
MIVMTSMIELEILFGPLFDEYFNVGNQVVSKSSAVTTADGSDKRQQQRDSTLSTSTLATTVTTDGNFDIWLSICELDRLMVIEVMVAMDISLCSHFSDNENDVAENLEAAFGYPGIELLSDATLLEDAQLKKALKKSKEETHKLQASGSSKGANFESISFLMSQKLNLLTQVKELVEDESDDVNDDDNANDDDSGNKDDDGNDAHDSERTNSDDDDDENPSFTLKDHDEEKRDEEYESDDDNENVYEEEDDDLIRIFDQRVSTLERELSQLKQADHSAQLLESAKSQIPTIKAQEERKLYIDVVEKSVKDIIKDEVKSLLPQILPKEVSELRMSLENVILAKSSSQPKSTYEAAVSLTEFELKKILFDKIEKSKSYQAAPEHRELYDGLVKSYNLDKDLFSSYGNVYPLKRYRQDEDKDKDPPTGSNQGLKKRKTSKDAEPPRGSKSKESKSSLSKGTKPQPKSSGNDKPDVSAPKDDWFKKPNKPLTPDRAWNTTKSIDFRPPQTWISNIAKAREPPLHSNEADEALPPNIKHSVTDRLDWNNLEGHGYPFDLSKLLLLIEVQGIEDMVPTLRSPVKKRIIAVTRVKVMKWYDYVYLEEVIVRRDDQKLYKFMEGDFSRVNMHVSKDIDASLGRVVILKRVEDLQLGVESYQKKLNLTKPVTFRSDISKMTLYTAYKNPQGIIYLDKYKRNRLMRSDELYKFCDGTLTSVRNVLHDIANNLRIEYLPKRRWNNLDRKRSHVMIKAIDQQLFERRLMRNLEKFVGGREYGEDFRLLDRTI